MTPDAPNAEMQRFDQIKRAYDLTLAHWRQSPSSSAIQAWKAHLKADEQLRDFVAALVRDKGRYDPDKLWDALRDVACSTGRDAKRIVMVTKQDVEKAVGAMKGQP